jgi:hypothetical protein
LLIPRLKELKQRIMIDRFRVHTSDDAYIIDNLGSEWQKLSKPRSIFSYLVEIGE